MPSASWFERYGTHQLKFHPLRMSTNIYGGEDGERVAQTDFRPYIYSPGQSFYNAPGMSVVYYSQWSFKQSFNLLIMWWWLATKDISGHVCAPDKCSKT